MSIKSKILFAVDNKASRLASLETQFQFSFSETRDYESARNFGKGSFFFKFNLILTLK